MPPRKFKPSAHDIAADIAARILVGAVALLAVLFVAGVVITVAELATP